MQLTDEATHITFEATIPQKLLKTFHPFPLLPSELRHMIWRCALLDPQLLTLNVLDEKDQEKDTYSILDIDRTGDGEWGVTCAFGTLVPKKLNAPLLYVCRESRMLALVEYDFCMSTFLPPNAVIQPIGSSRRWIVDHEGVTRQWTVDGEYVTKPGFPFQPAHDTVYIKEIIIPGEASVLTYWQPTEIKTNNIRSLALNLWPFEQEEFLTTSLSLLFPCLEELIIVSWDDDSKEVQEDGQLNVLECLGAVKAHVQDVIEENPKTWIPILRVMTEQMLAKYVSDKATARGFKLYQDMEGELCASDVIPLEPSLYRGNDGIF